MEKSFCQRPVRLPDFRNLLEERSYYELPPSGKGAKAWNRLLSLLTRIAPDPEDGIRRIGIEMVRGRPEEWKDPERLVLDGLISDREEYLEWWKAECPQEREWLEIALVCPGGEPRLLMTDREGRVCMVCRPDGTQGNLLAGEEAPLARFLVRVARSVRRRMGKKEWKR